MALSKKQKEAMLTPLELRVMQALWEHGSGQVAQVQAQLGGDLAYTTVQTMLNVLVRKGKAKRQQEGRAYRYEAAVSRERATGNAVGDLVRRMFGGSPEALLMAMVDSRQISPGELAELAAKLAAAEEAAAKKDKERA